MGWVRFEARNGLRCCLLGLGAATAALIITSGAADARHHRHVRVHVSRHVAHSHHRDSDEDSSPRSASIVVDGNTGAVLQSSNPDASRHPASLTKIMTLYLLFERLESGKLKLDSQLKVSEFASEQSPTKLGLKDGQTIAVEDAIKAVVTRSANDVAVVIAENIGGSEEAFAKLMTQKAHALSMSRTTYVNASGLPDDDQVTTARDQALLGRAIQDHFPRYYRYFSTSSFVYHGEAIRNHNHLLGSVRGVDGIKTGFTHSSGFNLVTSVHRDGHFIVAVVLGGRSAFERDAHMRGLIDTHIKEAGLKRTAPVLAERTEHEQRDEPRPVTAARAPVARAPLVTRADPTPTATVTAHAMVGSNAPIQPVLVKTITYRTAPVQTASLAPMPALLPTAAAAEPPSSVAQAVARPQAVEAPQIVVASAEPSLPVVAAPRAVAAPAVVAAPAKAVVARAEPPRPEPVTAQPPTRSHARGGWLIQIGAFDGEDEARQHLSEAQTKLHSALAAADPFTERVQKGEKSLYRARFAGFDKDTAEATCKQLKRSDFECMAVKN